MVEVAACTLLPGRWLALVSLLLVAGPALGEDRVLRVGDGEAVREYPVPELVAALGLGELAVPRDPHFGRDRTFAGLALGPLLEHVGLGDATEVLLVCEDGYAVALDTSLVAQPGLDALLALRDAAVAGDGEAHWPPFRHGAELVDFDPFYLVWASADPGRDVGSDALPWPFQLVEIRRFDRKAYFAPARPPEGSGDDLARGFATWRAHCGKCHRMRGVGGEVGPALDREGGLASVLPLEALRDFVRHEKASFPRSKMPEYGKLLDPAELDAVVAYLKAMQDLR